MTGDSFLSPPVDFAKLNMYLRLFAILSARIRDGRRDSPSVT
ncbi:hypothetical protein [Kroppenstedtia guangzhouensis]|nr:hypothetical protein [Kroppenstedtia guangzhouensis]